MTARISLLLLAGALALSACGQGAQAPQPVGLAASASPEDRVAAAIEAEGCVLNLSNSGSVLLRANLTRAQLQPIMEELGRQGRAQATGTAEAPEVRLISAACG